jgi:hypothetical protein
VRAGACGKEEKLVFGMKKNVLFRLSRAENEFGSAPSSQRRLAFQSRFSPLPFFIRGAWIVEDFVQALTGRSSQA